MQTATKLKPLRIGNVDLGFPAVQAALSGYSDRAMRLVARQLGASYTVAEVLIDRFVLDLKPGRRNTKHFLEVDDDEHPVGGQLMGSEPDHFAPAAKRLVEAGFDVIDINFGCPVTTAMGGCRGGYHLGQPDVALEIVQRVRDAVPPHIPVTVKMRRGIDDTTASRDNFFRILDGLFSHGASAATVHGRTVEQKYVGPSNWEFLAQVKRHVGESTILGSGDLFTPQDCLDMLEQTGVDGLSIARGAIGNPWIFQQTRELAETGTFSQPDLAEQARVLAMQFKISEETLGEKMALRSMRKHAIKYARLHPEHDQVRDAFVVAKSKADWHSVLVEHYADQR